MPDGMASDSDLRLTMFEVFSILPLTAGPYHQAEAGQVLDGLAVEQDLGAIPGAVRFDREAGEGLAGNGKFGGHGQLR